MGEEGGSSGGARVVNLFSIIKLMGLADLASSSTSAEASPFMILAAMHPNRQCSSLMLVVGT
jgi:hypothetical protein